MFLSSILIAGFEILNRTDVVPAVVRVQAIQREYLEDFLKDQSDLTTIPLFTQQTSRIKDAGPFLNPKFPWNPGFNGADEVPVAGESIEVKHRFKDALMRYGKDWVSHNSWFNAETFDFKIFEQLRSFDHWDLEVNSPIEKVGTTEPYLNGIEIPIPDVTNLVVLSQLYLMKAVDTKQTLQTLKDVRHLATLLLSTENLNLEMTGLRLLDFERVAHGYYLKNKLIKETEWQSLSATILSQATRAWPATAGYARLLTQDSTFKKVFHEIKPTGLCAALNSSVPHDWLLKPMLNPRVWPEPSFAKEYQRHEELIASAKSQCRLKYISRLMKAGSSYDRLPVPFPFGYLPFSRRTYGVKLATVGFTGFETYADPFARQRDPSAQ
jgi:hypothetical protein